MSFPRYPKYKDSGVEWLGEVPEHWGVAPLKRVASLRSGDSITSEAIEESGDYPVFGAGGIRGYTARYTHEGAFPIVGRQGALCGNVQFGEGRFWASEHAVVATPGEQYDPIWLREVLRAMNLNQYSISAAQPGLAVDQIGRLCIPIPAAHEQHAIASFLDRETAKIDALVAEQQRLMELLKEKRQAVISHAVTKGLNPDAPMKPSGVEWLGEVPAHWEVKPLGKLCSRIGSGKTPSGGADAYVERGVLFIRSQNVYDEGLRLEDVVYITDVTDAEMAWSRIAPGDLLLNITGASLGRTSIVPPGIGRANVNQHVCVIRLVDPTLREYVALVLKSSAIKAQGESVQNGAAREGLNYTQIAGFLLALPPESEASQIVQAVKRALEVLDELGAEGVHAVSLLEERRSALISAAVTGQIDVRHLAHEAAA